MIEVEVSPADLFGLMSGERAHVVIDGEVRIVLPRRHDEAERVAAQIARVTFLAAIAEFRSRDLRTFKSPPPRGGDGD